jgi:AbrB family looped-hinge helix DNA binding protein
MIQCVDASIFQSILFHLSQGALGLDGFGRNSYNMCMKTVVSEKGQITIPKALRLRLGIRPGQALQVEEERGRMVVTKSESGDPVEEVFGILDLGRPTDQLIASLRGELGKE